MKKLKRLDIVKTVVDICKKLNELDDYMDSLPKLHGEMDCRMSDIYHTVWNNSLTSTQSKRITDELKTICENRGNIKDDISYTKIFRDNIGKLTQRDNREMLISRLQVANKCRENGDYSYRVYTEDEINKLLGVKKNIKNEVEKIEAKEE